ncbi:unnamed protein product [Clonostachys rhizophaga]|uniref:NADP-dependent oxidoreductase domain-containing protein n=1 Tax=Clonostachys rhizophaga TaxID=160324 RepID=A0A9N9VDY3_9HYPO|nr:unnamed protein product [Clonostachys rhizophaga]
MHLSSRAIGVSDHTIDHLEALITATGVVPAVNQVERHPILRQDDLVTYCKAKGIHITAYSAFGNNMFNLPLLFSHQEVKDVAEKISSETKTRVTPTQVLLAWAQHGGHSVIPKSVTPARIAENFKEVDLSEEHIKAVESIGAQQRRYNIPYIANKPMWDINIFGDKAEKSATHRVIV